MATPNNYDARGIIDFLSKLDPEMANVLNGEAMVTRIKEEFKNQSEEGRKAAERMAKNLRNSGNNISAQLQEIEREASKAGYNIFFSYNEGRKQIDIKMERRAGVRGDKNAPATKINPVNFKIDVGSAKAGYNNGVPSTKSLSIQQKDDLTYFATATEDVLRGIKETLVEINKSGKGENRSTAAANSMMKDAVKKANKGLVAHTNHASVNDEYFDDDRYEGDSRRRQLFMQTNAKMAGVIDSVMKKLKGKRQKIKIKDGLDIDDSQLQRDILIYIEAAQKKTLGKETAEKILGGRGYSKEDIEKLAEAIGKDLLAIENTVNLGSDRSMATLTESYMGARDTLLGNYGRSDRHPSQGRNTVKKINGGKRKKTSFREVDLQNKGYYDSDYEHEAYTSAQISSEDIQSAYLKVRKNAEDSFRRSLQKQNEKREKKRSNKEIEEVIQSGLKKQGYIDFDPSVDDDMMIAKASSLRDLTGTRERSTQLSKEEHDKYVDDATKKVNNIINDSKKKSKKIKFGKKTYDLKDDAQRQEYIQKYVVARAISGLKPNEIYGDVSINPFIDEDGNEMFSLSTQQLVGGGQQEKVVTGGIGERNYAFALNDKIFKKIVKQLKNDGVLPENFDVGSLDFIREKGDFKSNEMGQLAISRLGYLFGKSKDKKGFVDVLKKSPLGSFITGLTKDGSGIEFSESDDAMNAFINDGDGGLTSLYNWMSETDLSALGIDENGKVFNKDARAFIYETEAGLADVFKWTKRVQTGKKEREAQMRTAAVSGSSSSYTKQLQERYKGSNAKDRKIIEKAERDIAEIESAIFEKTSSTANWDDKKISDFIKTKSFKKGSFLEKGIKDTTKTAITMGVGDQYSINTEKYKDIIAEYQRGHISEEDFMKTWEGEAEAIRQEMIASGIDPSQIETIIDPGQVFGFSAFGDQYQGRLLHLGNTSPDSMIDPVTGKTVYNRSEYASGVNSLFKAMGSKAKNKKSKVSEAAANVTLGMFGTASTHHGALNERANKRRLGHSASFKTSGITPEQIEGLTGDQKDRYIDSGFISKDAMRSLLMDTYDYEKEDGTIDEDKYLKALYDQYNASGLKDKKSFDDKSWGTSFKEKQRNLINRLLEMSETEGLRGMFNRFPSIDSEAVKNSRLFVSKDITDKGTMKVGSGLAKAINADFDGDTINVILKMLSDYSGDKTEDWDRDVMQKVYKMRGGKKVSKTDEERQKSYEDALSGADDAFLKEISGLAAKVNNQYIGNFSNMSTSIRNALGETEYDETRAVYTDGKMNQSSFEKIAKGLVVKAVGQTLEQDAISAKKVEQRIVEEISKAQEEKEKELRRKLDPKNQEDAKILKDLRSDIASKVTNDFENLSKKIRDGGFESDSEFIKALGDLGITKDGKFDSLGMTTAMAQIQKMAEMNGIDKSVVSKIFGGIDITSDTFDGKLDTNVVSGILKSTSKDLYGDKKGFFYRGDQFNPAVATARSNNAGSKGDSYEVIRRMKSNGFGDNLVEIEDANVLFNERGEILRAVADAYKYEIGMEEKKIGVALREADAIKKAGKSWKDYSDLISKKYKLDEEAEKVAGKGDFYVASNKVLSEGGFTRTTPSAIKNILNPRTDGTTGLDKSVLDDRVAKGLFKPKKGELVKAFGVDSEKTLMSLFNTSQSIIGGNLAHAIAQGDKAGAKEFETELKNLLSVFGKSAKEIETVISAFQKAGTNMSVIADNFGKTVGNELPIAGVSTDGNYLINGRMDALRYQQRQNQYTGKMDDVYTILDYKTRADTGIKYDDVAQVVMYQEMFKDMQKTWMTDDRFKGMSDKDLLDVARVDIAKSLSGGERSKEAIDNLVNSLTEEDINRIRNGARIESGVVVGDSRGGASQAYKISGSITSDIKDMVMGGDWEKLSPDQIAALLSMQQKITSPDFYKEGNYVAPQKEPEKPKTKDDKEAEKKKNQEDFVKLLEQEYKLRLKIAELKGKKALSTNDEEKKNLETLIGYNEGLLNKKVAEREKAGKKAGLKGKSGESYKNNILSAEEAKYRLELQKQAERLTKGTDGIAGKKGLFNDFGKQFKGYIVNMFSAYRIISKITQELRKCVQIAKELDKAATNIRIVTGMSSEEVDVLMRKYTGLARELGVTTQIVAQSGQEWMRQGYNAEQANDLIVSSTKLSKLGMMDMNNATKVLTSTMKGFKLEASDVGQVVDKLTKLDMNYATTAADIGEAMSRTAAIAHQMGVSLDETAAMVTTIMDITQQSAEMTGTAIRTILSRYGNVKSGSFVSMLTDGEDLDKINDIEKVLSVLGIEIRKSGLEMRDVGDVLDQLALKWTTLSDVEKNAVATAFAGTRQRNQFVVLMDNWKQVEEATDMAANAAGTADDKYGAYMDSIEARLNKLQTAWEEFTQKLSTSSFVKGAVSVLTFLVEHLDKILTLLGSISAYLMAKKLWANVGKLGGIFNGLSTIGFKKGAADAAANPNGGIINRIFGTTQKGFTTVSSKLDQIMAIMNGEQTGDAAMSVVDSMAVTRRAKLSKANELEIESQKEKLKRSKTNKAQIQSKIDRLEAQNSALKGKGFDVGNGKTITMRKGPNGDMMYYETTMNPKTQKPRTRKIGSNSADAQNALAQKKAQTKQRSAGAAAAGLMSGIMAGMSGTNSYFGNMIGGENIKINDIKSDTTDNIINGVATGAATGLLSAIPGVGPLLGPILGPIIGDGIGGLFKWLRHKDEIDRKERVEEAKKNLEALNKVQSAIESAENSIFDMSTPESVSKAKNDVDAIIDALLESDNREKILSRLNKTVEEIEGTLLTGTEEEKREILSVINSENNSATAIETFRAQEQDRYDAYKKYNDLASKEITIFDNDAYKNMLEETGYYNDMVAHTTDSSTTYYTTSLSGSTSADKANNASEAIKELNKKANSDNVTKAEKEFLDGEIKRLQGIVDAHNDYQAEILKMNKEVNKLEIKNAFSKSGFDKWTSLDVSSASIEEVVQTFANNLELTGAAVRDSTGEITDYARLQIETFLRSNERFSSLFSSSGKTLNQIMSSLNKQKDLLDQTQAASFEELKNAFDTQNKDSILTYLQNMGYSVEDLTYTLEDGTVKFTNTFETASNELMRLVYKYDDSQIEGIARALNMTTEDLLEMRKLLGNVKLSDLILSPEETRSSFNELNNIFSELSTSGAVTGENLEKLNTKYFSLYNNYDENGDVISTSFNNVLENLRKRLFGDQNTVGTQGFLYQNATFQTLKEDSGLYDSFYYQVKNNNLLYNKFDENQKKLLESANSLTDIMHLFNDETFGGEMQGILIEILNDLNMNNDYYKEIQDKLIEWQKYENDTVIDNLKSQIDALNDINKEREKEIALIKAKEALENAQKEKVRVYRAGVGWTYETNQQKVSDAKEDLEKLERENNAENLQYQIDLLEQQNSMLDNISKNEELKGLKNSVDSYVSYMRNTFGKDVGSDVTSLLDNSNNYIMKWDDYVKMMGKQANASVLNEQDNILKQTKEIQSIDTKMKSLESEGKTHTADYISLQEQRNKAVKSISESKKKLSNWDVKTEDINAYLASEGITGGYGNIDNSDLYNAQALNEEYYTFNELNYKGEQTDSIITRKLGGLYSADEISKAIDALEDGDSDVTVKYKSKDADKWTNEAKSVDQLYDLPDGTVVGFSINNHNGKKDDGTTYAVKDGLAFKKLEALKDGTFSLNKDVLALINEVGTEGVVTPQGTITALPSKTGVVPADLTRNLYNLGEVAPNLVKKLGDNQVALPNNQSNLEDNSMNVENLYATFETDDGFDFEKLLISARQYIKNTKR